MRLPTAISPDMTEFPLNLAAGLRMVFADVACAPIPHDLRQARPESAVLMMKAVEDGL